MDTHDKDTKEAIRTRHRQRRAAMTPAARSAAGAALAVRGAAWAASLTDGGTGTFAAYLGVGLEPPTLPLLEALHVAGHRVLLPVCEPDLELSWVAWTPQSEYVRSRYAPLQEPVGERLGTDAVAGAAGIFVPATAVDLDGNRIGQGGGYYDKFLAALSALPGNGGSHPVPTAGVVYADEVLPAGTIPVEVFDRKVGAALTPAGLVPTGAGR
ncbi:5-formyltetrahydrofolate cyclo-ligase [Arthrobacter sp. 1P04PC]|uniref:5-formyltetrahydrofolate cyclo-ligase n=1 Tax=unclassified Arthrobacter TaxID=235627 RepID=UPI0039A3DC7F